MADITGKDDVMKKSILCLLLAGLLLTACAPVVKNPEATGQTQAAEMTTDRTQPAPETENLVDILLEGQNITVRAIITVTVLA